ncbi:DoxX family protein [Hoeflea sp. WL0058]|uniref:DoxX family protein n=1 Tax=Flavimaribacter sediminis TaxID=2865987 RepID=A0AAE3D1C3_9HYPH|nr:DoxX family protein [Flavimaribacter sediminis]MBW8637418.1 DoxX family protein [Flavimaribacter sediminis]
MSNAATLLIGRILLSAIFILAGLNKLGDPAGTAGYMTSLGLPLASVGVWLVILLEVLGGIAVLIGFMTAPASLALALFCIVSAFLAHFNLGDQTQFVMFFKNLAIAGGFLVLAAHGPGSISVDARRNG